MQLVEKLPVENPWYQVMSELKIAGLAVGGVLALCGLMSASVPGIVRDSLRRVPRNVVLGWILAAAAFGWSAWMLHQATFLSSIAWGRRAVVYLTPVAYGLVVCFMDELLAARAFGALLLLIPRPILDAAFLHDQSPWRYVLTVFAYVLVVAGILVVLSPYRLRKFAEAIGRSDMRLRLVGLAHLILGGLLLVLSFTVY